MTSAVLRLVLSKISPLRDLLADDLLNSAGQQLVGMALIVGGQMARPARGGRVPELQ
jgi:hypothetical protein